MITPSESDTLPGIPLPPDELVADVLDEQGHFELTRICQVLHLPRERFEPTDADLLAGELGKILGLLRQMDRKAVVEEWIHAPNTYFGGEQPATLLLDHAGRERLAHGLLAVMVGDAGY